MKWYAVYIDPVGTLPAEKEECVGNKNITMKGDIALFTPCFDGETVAGLLLKTLSLLGKRGLVQGLFTIMSTSLGPNIV